MKTSRDERPMCGYRVWITTCPSQWRPAKWHEIPPDGDAVQPIGDEILTEERAANLVEGFNRVMLRARDRVWAVAVPAKVALEDGLRPGEHVAGAAVRFSPLQYRKRA